MQRFVKTLRLGESPDAIREYIEIHNNIWPEIVAGIRQVGISAMDIYLDGNTAVMIMEAPDNVDVDEAMKQLASLPRQAEWEEHVARFQQCSPGDTSAEKWHIMDKIFSLPL